MNTIDIGTNAARTAGAAAGSAGWVLAHDGSMAGLLPAMQARAARVHRWPDAPSPQAGERWLAAFDWHRAADALALQARARAQGASLLLLGLEPGSVSVGPWLAADDPDAPCLECLLRWTQLNLGQPWHWSAGTQAPPRLRQASQAALAPAGHALFDGLLAEVLAQPGRVRACTLRLHWDRLLTEPHRFQRHPACTCCTRLPADDPGRARLRLQPRPVARPGAARVANPALSVAALRERFVDRRTGVVKHLFHDLGSELMPMVAAEMALPGSDRSEIGYGRNDSREGSEQVALLEALERFCGHEPRRHGDGVRGSFESLRARHGSRVVDPRDFVLHGSEQMAQPGYTFEPYSDALPFDWSWGWSMRRGEAVLVPQQMVYYRLGDRPAGALNRFVYETSSGCALGGCLEEAALYGLLELLERDAYLTSWYGRIPPRELRLDEAADGRVRALVARARSQGYRVHAFDMRLDIDLPLVWALIVDPRDEAPVKSYCASAAHFQWEQALFSALVEVTTSIGVYQHSMPAQREHARALAADPWRVRGMSDHVLLYSLPETWPRLGFLFDGGPVGALPAPEPAPTDLRDEFERRVRQALTVASDVIVVNQTWAPMEAMNLHCVKVLAPGLTPVTFGHQHRRCALPRLNAARRARGLPAIDEAGINPDPHNFP
ncbi:TOMM precursor leader peptide-binding protein [Pseudorhodoferax sp.]|uniref:TOMM precursor leader peptide-binding protein n=1 Tax=Pseudorhodoferax sp. TaxID=1993553 RepID=UPI002DD6A54C|nr:TOMM precursor leader peptide-binding protein [Pseudorhodoferax sp.]